MNSSAILDVLPLTGADCFLRAFDDEVRRKAGASHVSQLVLRLGPGFDADALRKVVEAVTLANPILRAPIGRRFGVGAPVYFTGRASRAPLPTVEVHEGGAERGAIPELFFERMNRRFRGRRGELLRFDVVRYAGGARGADLAMSWLHMLFDGAGSEAFLRWLDSVQRGARRADELPEDEADAAPGLPRGLGARERGRRASAWQRHMRALGGPGVRSPAGPLRRTRQALRYEVRRFGAEETAAIEAAASQRAGFLTPMLFYLAVALRAHHAALRTRGRAPAAYVVPLPVNLRRRGAPEALFRTRVSLLWFRVSATELDDLGALLAALKRQRRDAIAAGLVEGGALAMDYARTAPMRLYAHVARRSLGGELCSFFFAWTGAFAEGLERFLGAEVEEGFHAPAVPPSPGSGLAMSVHRGRLGVTHVRQRGAFAEAELEALRAQLEADLGGGGP
jgi:hypothetical protein